MLLSTREMVRRWYGQINTRSPMKASKLKSYLAHAIIPADLTNIKFGPSNFIPLSDAYDLILSSEINSADEVTGLSLKAYKPIYNAKTNTVTYIHPSTLVFAKDLKQRPYRNILTSRTIDSETELGLLTHALEMESQLDILSSYPNLLSEPIVSDIVCAFNEEEAPKFEISESLIYKALASLTPNKALKELCAPETNDTLYVKTIVRDTDHDLLFIELSNYFCVECPGFAKPLVRQGQTVRSHQPLVNLTLSEDVLNTFIDNIMTMSDVLYNTTQYLGKIATDWLLKTTWKSLVSEFNNQVMVPHYLVSQEHLPKVKNIYRCLNSNLGREIRDFRSPSKIAYFGSRESKICIWKDKIKFDLPNTIFDLEDKVGV